MTVGEDENEDPRDEDMISHAVRAEYRVLERGS